MHYNPREGSSETTSKNGPRFQTPKEFLGLKIDSFEVPYLFLHGFKITWNETNLIYAQLRKKHRFSCQFAANVSLPMRLRCIFVIWGDITLN